MLRINLFRNGRVMRANKIACVLLAVSGLAAGKAAIAHENDDGWHFLIEPYVMFPNMKGDIGIGVLPPAHVDEGPDDIFSNLQMGVMLYAEAYNSRWAFSSDVLYMYLKSDVAAGAGDCWW